MVVEGGDKPARRPLRGRRAGLSFITILLSLLVLGQCLQFRSLPA